MPLKWSSTASWSSTVTSRSPLFFLDARRACRKTSTCGSKVHSQWQGRPGQSGDPSRLGCFLLEASTQGQEGRGHDARDSPRPLTLLPASPGALTSDFLRDCCTSFRNSSWCSASSRWPSKIWHQMIPGKGQNKAERPALEQGAASHRLMGLGETEEGSEGHSARA